MQLPSALRAALENGAYDAHAAHAISLRYREQVADGANLINNIGEAYAYAGARMPATYAATYTALKWTLECVKTPIASLVDVGAGTGAASWAAREILNVKDITCLERQEHMRALGEQWLPEAKWREWELSEDAPLPEADLVIASYVLNEMPGDMRVAVARRLLRAARQILLIVEPGTPKCYHDLMDLRASMDAPIAAPCACKNCPLVDDDWCHFACRVERTRLHKRLKGGDAPFEDEKFSYLAFVKFGEPAVSRIIRPPELSKGRIDLTLCTTIGVENRRVLKRDIAYKAASKARWGDALGINPAE